MTLAEVVKVDLLFVDTVSFLTVIPEVTCRAWHGCHLLDNAGRILS